MPSKKVVYNALGFSAKKTLTLKNYFFIASTACFENGKHEVNLIGIDWTGAQDPFYVFSTLRVQRVGKAVAKLIGSAVLTNYIDLNNVELIGHSLGAHAAGYGKSSVQKKKSNAYLSFG